MAMSNHTPSSLVCAAGGPHCHTCMQLGVCRATLPSSRLHRHPRHVYVRVEDHNNKPHGKLATAKACRTGNATPECACTCARGAAASGLLMMPLSRGTQRDCPAAASRFLALTRGPAARHHGAREGVAEQAQRPKEEAQQHAVRGGHALHQPVYQQLPAGQGAAGQGAGGR